MANSVTVSEVRTTSDNQLRSITNQMEAYLLEIKQFVQSELLIPELETATFWVDPTHGFEVRQVAAATRPASVDLTQDAVAAPVAPALATVNIPDFGNIPELNLAAPTINLPTAPNSSLPGAPGAAPEFNTPAIPTAPTVTLPTAPTLQNVALPVMPGYSIPTFTPTPVLDDLLTPTTSFSYVEVDYQSAMLDELKLKLINDLLNGGYGIDVNDELALWERARERELLNAETAMQEAMRQAAARGFSTPPGAYQAQMDAARNEALMKNSSLSRDIALKRSDLYVQNRQFTMTQAREVEQMLITAFGYARERALNVAKYTAEFGIQIFNALVSRFNARQEAARTAAQIYDTQLKAALAGLEAYKVEVEGARLTVEIQKMYVDVYSTQLEGVTAFVNVYKTQMEAARIAAEVEKLKLDAFRSRVEAYTAQVGAKNAEFDMFKAQIGGEMAKVDIYKAQVDAYGSQVQAHNTKAQSQKIIADTQLGVNQLVLEEYKARLGAYAQELERAQAEVKLKLQQYQGDLQRYSTSVQAEASAASAINEAQKANSQLALQRANMANTGTIQQASLLERHAQSTAAAAQGGLNGYVAAMNAEGARMSGIVAEIQSA